MSSVLAPTGVRPVGKKGYAPYDGAYTQYALTSNNSAALAMGDLVALVGGTVVPVTASPVASTLSANTPIGIFMGVNYFDNLHGRPFVNSQILQANCITAGYTNVQVLVEDDPSGRYVVQANGPVTVANIGAAIALTNFGASDLVVKTSRVEADAASISTSSATTLAMKIIGIDPTTDNAPGDAFTKILVQWNSAVHYWAVQGAH